MLVMKPRSLGDLVSDWYTSKGKFLVVLVNLSDPRRKVESRVIRGGIRGQNTIRRSSELALGRGPRACAPSPPTIEKAVALVNMEVVDIVDNFSGSQNAKVVLEAQNIHEKEQRVIVSNASEEEDERD
ncbi:hypothetical protein Tco_0651035 [Tanacetum coccineum]